MNVFTYGTLSIPAVMRAVSGEQVQCADAHLNGFERFMLKDCIYPGIIYTGEGQTRGRIYFDVSTTALQRLDRYEDDGYVRCRVEVHRSDGTLWPAEVFLLADTERHRLTGEPWDEARFMRDHLADFQP